MPFKHSRMVIPAVTEHEGSLLPLQSGMARPQIGILKNVAEITSLLSVEALRDGVSAG